jgi:hypothetical protein
VTSYDMVRTYVRWEHDNRNALAAWPAIRQSADKMRLRAKDWFATARAARDAYSLLPDQDNRDALQKSLGILRTALAEATRYMAEPTTQPKP